MAVLSIEKGNATRVGVASHKPCKGCGRSWEEAGGGWLAFDHESGGKELQTVWHCDPCFASASASEHRLPALESGEVEA